MPIYDFECQACGHKFEANAPIAKRNELQVCPECLKKEGKKLPSATSMTYDTGHVTSNISNGFNDVLKKIKSGAGTGCTIKTK